MRKPAEACEIGWIVSRNVARAMRLRAINFTDTARISGIGTMTLWRLLRGEGEIRLGVVLKIASALDIPMRAMLSEDFIDGHNLSNRALYCARLANDCDDLDVCAIIEVLRNHQGQKTQDEADEKDIGPIGPGARGDTESGEGKSLRGVPTP